MRSHILVVDDDQDIRSVVVDILTMSDYRVQTATNGAEALRQIRAEPPVAVLLDLKMPVMDGREFLSRCRTEAVCAPLPVVIMSGLGNGGALADELGAQAFLPKPFEMDAVLSLVGQVTRG